MPPTPPLPSTPAPRPRRKGERTRRRILDAAEVLFAERGYEGAHLRDVAARVGIRTPSLYNHFPNKESLYAAVIERGIGPVLTILSRFVEAEGEAHGDSRRVVEQVMELLARRPSLPRLLLHETLAGGQRLTPVLRVWIAPIFRKAHEMVEAQPAGRRWEQEQIPLLVLAMFHIVVGYFTIAPLYKEVNGEDLLTEEARAKQTRFLVEVVERLLAEESPAEDHERRVRSSDRFDSFGAGGASRMDVDVEFLASESWDTNMHARMKWLRENDPVHWSEKDGLWLVSKFEDVSHVSKDQETFTSAGGVRPGNPGKLGLIDEAEPRHGQLRGLINKGFSPRMVKNLEPVFRGITTEAIDRIAKKGTCDFVDDIAVPLPLRLIAAMIGIREQDYDDFHRWSDTMIAADGNRDDPEIVARAGAAYMEYANYVTKIIEDRRRDPRDDLVSILTGAKDRGLLREYDDSESFQNLPGRDPKLANDELIKLLVLLLVAGNETTRNAISGGMQLLIENPGERQKLIDDPSLLPAAVEEMVRFVSPVHSFARTVTRDTRLRDKDLHAGQKVLLLYPSANRDADEFEDPESFQVERNPNHLGFGIGNHFCLGANLARTEMRVAFEELLRRLPDMEYVGEGPEIRPSALVRSCMHMVVRFTPED